MFKFVLVLALVAVVVAQHHDEHHGHDDHHGYDDHHAEIEHYESHIDKDGFHYDFDTSNHIKVAAKGDEHGNINGDFHWIAPKGEHIDVVYEADEHGYHPKVEFSHK